MILRVVDAFQPRGATWSGQVISPPPGPSGGPSKTHLLPGGGVPRVHRARSPVPPGLPRFATPRSVHGFAAVATGAYPLHHPPNAWSPGAPAPGSVLLACRQWDPLGLARWLPSLGVGAWRSAPLLPWRMQCPGRVCAALAAVWGGSGRYLVSCLPRFPLPAPRVPRRVWRAVPPGCPLPSLAGTAFLAVCAFRVLGPVALLVFPACPLCVCALALPRCPLPPPLPPVGVARAPRAVPALGAGRAVPRSPCPSACPAPVSCSVWRAWGGGGAVPFPPYLAWNCALPVGWVCASGAFPCRGMGSGGGGGLCAVPPVCAAGGGSGAGGRSASFRPSAFPGQVTKRVPLASFWSWRAWPPYCSGLCSLAVSGRGPCGALAHWRGFPCSPRFLWEQAAGAGGRACSGPPPGRRGPGWGRGGHPLCPGGMGAGAPAACGPLGGGGGAPRPPCSPSGGRPAVPYPAPLSSPAHSPPGVRVRSGSRGRPVPRVRPAWRGGGGRGVPRNAPLGALTDPTPPSALPEWATLRVSLAMLWSFGARPPYCSGSSSRAAPGRGPYVAPVLWCGLTRRPRPPRELAVGGAGARGVRVQLSPPPGVAVLSGEGGTSPRHRGGGGPALLRLAGRGGAGGGGRSAAPRPPAPLGGPWPPPLSSFVCGAPPWGILVLWGLPGGHWRQAQPGRPPVGQCGGGEREGGE